MDETKQVFFGEGIYEGLMRLHIVSLINFKID